MHSLFLTRLRSYVAVVAKDRRRYLSWDDLIEAERGFFRSNALLKGLKPDRWGIPTLKVSFAS